jgi:hypothetical protein
MSTLLESILRNVKITNEILGRAANEPYKEFVAIITQSSISAPTMVVKQNTLELPTITLTRSAAGAYSSDFFTADILPNYLQFSTIITSPTTTYGGADTRIEYTASIINAFSSNYVLNISCIRVAADGSRVAADIGGTCVLTIKYWV